MDLNKVKEALELQQRALSLLEKGPMSYYFEELVASYELLLSRFAPFKVGDKVKLTKDLREGWEAVWHTILVKGAQGVVERVDCGKSGFRIQVKLDFRESHCDHSFTLREEDLEVAPASRAPEAKEAEPEAKDCHGVPLRVGLSVKWIPLEAKGDERSPHYSLGFVERIDNSRRVYVNFGGVTSAVDSRTLTVLKVV